jgi:hypothetical protein
MKTKVPGILICVLICPLIFTAQAQAATEPNTALTLIGVVGGVLVAVEGINLAVNAIKNSRPKSQTRIKNTVPLTNLSAKTNIPGPETNRMVVPPVTNLPASVTNVAVTPKTNTVIAMPPMTNTNRTPVSMTNKSAETNLLSIHPSVLSNLTENEKQDIMLFGRDYYYLVSLAYYQVGKQEKSREFMFHSLAIEVRIEESTQFLKEKFHLSDAEIRTGKNKYLRSHE